MKKLYVISDLHLGGEPGFQMCASESQARLVTFIEYVTEQAMTAPVQLLVNGDVVDFLAEKPWQDFTGDGASARRKLEQIFDHTAPVWEAWQKFLGAEHAQLTILTGNHDIELSYAEVRKALRQKLGRGQLEIIYDNEAYVEGPVLIEHGNRYDKWNAVPHLTLRDYRSRLSRREKGAVPPSIPGSKLVVEVMNRFKQKYPFIDQLKPEIHMAIPLLLAIEPAVLHALPELLELWDEKQKVKLQDKQGNILSPYVAGPLPVMAGGAKQRNDGLPLTTPEPEMLLEELRELVEQARATQLEGLEKPAHQSTEEGAEEDPAGAAALQAQVAGMLQRPPAEAVAPLGLRSYARAGIALLHTLVRGKLGEREEQLTSLGDLLRQFLPQLRMDFDLKHEEERYLTPARRAIIEGGFQVVLYGHTHLAKQIDVLSDVPGDRKGVYINTGTWADLMRIPEELLTKTAGGSAFMAEFTAELRQTGTSRLRAQNPTYALIEFGDQVTARLYTFTDANPAVPAHDLV